jgi:hypothetical protein
MEHRGQDYAQRPRHRRVWWGSFDRGARGRNSSLPLEGTRVVDFSRVLAGPHCATTLLDLGAHVVKSADPADQNPISDSAPDPGPAPQANAETSAPAALRPEPEPVLAPTSEV